MRVRCGVTGAAASPRGIREGPTGLVSSFLSEFSLTFWGASSPGVEGQWVGAQVRIASPGPLACNMCCLQRSQQWLVHHVEPFDVTPARPIDPQYPPVGWFSVRLPTPRTRAAPQEESSFLTRCSSFFLRGVAAAHHAALSLSLPLTLTTPQEESSFLTRCTSFFFPGWRPLTYTLLSGAPPTEELLQHAPFDGSRLVLTHHKGVRQRPPPLPAGRCRVQCAS